MGDSDEHRRKVIAGLRQKARSLGVSIMNNTKWREVFRAAADPHLRVGAQRVRWEEYDDEGQPLRLWMIGVRPDQIGETGLRDPGFGGGPCKYWEIIEAYFESAGPTEAERAEWKRMFESELRALNVAHRVTDGRVVVAGYDSASQRD